MKLFIKFLNTAFLCFAADAVANPKTINDLEIEGVRIGDKLLGTICNEWKVSKNFTPLGVLNYLNLNTSMEKELNISANDLYAHQLCYGDVTRYITIRQAEKMPTLYSRKIKAYGGKGTYQESRAYRLEDIEQKNISDAKKCSKYIEDFVSDAKSKFKNNKEVSTTVKTPMILDTLQTNDEIKSHTWSLENGDIYNLQVACGIDKVNSKRYGIVYKNIISPKVKEGFVPQLTKKKFSNQIELF